MNLSIPTKTVTHGMFEIERVYPADPARVFRALSEPGLKQKWFFDEAGKSIETFEMDFRVDGHDIASSRAQSGPMAGKVFTNRTTYLDIQDGRRIALAYTMAMGDYRISASLATFELLPAENGGTRLVYTEQGAFFEHSDGPVMRKEGWTKLLTRLADAGLD